MHQNSQQELVERARGGDPDAWERLYLNVYPRLRSYAASRAGTDAADDLVGETMARAVASIGKFRWEPSGFDAWLFGILRRVCFEHLRRQNRRRREPAFLPVDTLLQPGEDVVLSDDHTEMRRAFSRLSPKERELLELRLVSGLSVDEVAGVLGKRAGAIRTAQSRAVANLRQLLDGTRCD